MRSEAEGVKGEALGERPFSLYVSGLTVHVILLAEFLGYRKNKIPSICKKFSSFPNISPIRETLLANL